jgi:predicted dehydrogenase
MIADPVIQPSSTGDVRWGILAPGGIARAFARDLTLHGHRVTAVGSRSAERAASFAEEFGISRAHGSYEELVSDPDVDVVYIATPHSLHAENALAALDAGKHVLVEKAFTLNAEQARAVVTAGDERGLVVLEAMWTRFLPHMDFVRDIIEAGEIGEIRSVHAEHAQQLPTDPAHRLNDLGLGGGALLDLGVYPVSFVHDILGIPETISAMGTLRATGVDLSVATMMQHADDAISTTYSTMETRGGNAAAVLGTKGRIAIDPTWYAPAFVTVLDERGAVARRFEQPVSGRGMQYQATEMERLLHAGERVSRKMTTADSIAVMETMDRVRAAIGVHYPGE